VRVSREGASIHRNVLRFRSGLVFKAHRLCVSLNSRLESNEEEEKGASIRGGASRCRMLQRDVLKQRVSLTQGSGCV